MTLTVLQPGYLPGLAFFAMWAAADVTLLADDLQYSTRSNLNRTRIKSATGSQWLTVPVLTKARLGQRIAEVEIDPFHEWRPRHWRTLHINYAPAPYWGRYEEALGLVYQRSWSRLLELNLALLQLLAEELALWPFAGFTSGVKTRPERTEKVLDLLEAWGCDSYLVLPRDYELIDPSLLRRANKRVWVAAIKFPRYHQLFDGFVPGLSLLDMLMNEGQAAGSLVRQSITVSR